MNEYQRQAYLDVLGVEQYVPRWQFAQAPEPVTCELSVLDEVRSVEQPSSETRAASAPQKPVTGAAVTPPVMTDVLRDMTAPETDRRPRPIDPEAAPVPEKAADAATVAPFKLSIWRSPLPLLVLDAREPKAALPTDRLLHNLLAALGAETGQGVSEEVLPWPLINNPKVRLTTEDARQELHSWLEAELRKRPVKHLLLMGENAARHFLPNEQRYDEALWQSFVLPVVDRQALVAPSLAELLRDCSLKRPLWQALQAWLPMAS
ncbi:hypothetical protein [Marinimicrobium sp. ARAG 43.8]|uniref:hypothetical protein n=1 Tax=Marinimicrobium sp. ARAG 43.8 TaxID=3418719 RepID=UPI003CF533B4